MALSWLMNKRVEMDIKISIYNPGRNKDIEVEHNEAYLRENFIFMVDPRLNISDLRSFIIGAINAMEDENPDIGDVNEN